MESCPKTGQIGPSVAHLAADTSTQCVDPARQQFDSLIHE